jgi:hypothetical protein
MQYLTAALVLASTAGATATPSAPPQLAPLRQTLRQYQPETTVPPPRQLSANERAILRRQLLEFGQPEPSSSVGDYRPPAPRRR